MDHTEKYYYYPYGFLREGGSYRYGYNGMQREDAIAGAGNTYDFGARLLSSLYGSWFSIDPLAGKYPSFSPYVAMANNPINAIDPDGKKVIFVNGYYNTGDGLMPSILVNRIGSVGKQGYWGNDFIQEGINYFRDSHYDFIDGRGTWNSTGAERYEAGYNYAKTNFTELVSGMQSGETMKIVSHSMGSAHAEGIIKYLMEQQIPIEKVVHFSAADPSGFSAGSPSTYQLNIENDYVLKYKNFLESDIIDGVRRFGEVSTTRGFWADFSDSHGDTKLQKSSWHFLKDMENLSLHQTNSQLPRPFSNFTGPSNTYESRGSQTQFKTLQIGGKKYNGTGKSNEYKGSIK